MKLGIPLNFFDKHNGEMISYTILFMPCTWPSINLNPLKNLIQTSEPFLSCTDYLDPNETGNQLHDNSASTSGYLPWIYVTMENQNTQIPCAMRTWPMMFSSSSLTIPLKKFQLSDTVWGARWRCTWHWRIQRESKDSSLLILRQFSTSMVLMI